MFRNSKFDVDFVDFNRKIDNLTEKVFCGIFFDRHILISNTYIVINIVIIIINNSPTLFVV